MAFKEACATMELAKLLNVAVSSIVRQAKRENWQSRPRHGRGGGKEWLVATMPEATRLALQAAEEKRLLKQPASLPAVAQVAPQVVSNAALDDKRRYKALAKADLLSAYLAWQAKHGNTIEQKEAFCLAYLAGAWPSLLAEIGPRVSWKSLERWKLERKSAGSVLALADRRGLARKGVSMLTDAHKTIILGQVLHPNAPQVSQAARRIQARCQAEGLAVPSDATIRRWVTAYTQECYGEWTLWREGKKAWNDKCALSIIRDWTLVDVGDVVIADGHTLNFETINPDTGKPTRMTLLLFFDGASRYPLGWEVMATENIACISSAFRRTCLVLGKFPRVVYLDNGRAFRARFFKGCPDFQQAGFLGLYRDLGCEVIHAWPYHGQSKPVERFFGTLHDMEVAMPSYTGWDIAHKPARLHRNEKLHQRLHENLGGRPLTLDETHTALARWFMEYANRPQLRTHLCGKTPEERFRSGVGPGVDADRLTLMMLQKEIRTITKDGISLHGRLYWHEALANRRHSVLVRYDDQLSPHTVLVYDADGHFICEARDRAHHHIASGIHPAARVLGTAAQQRDLAEAIELKKAQERAAMGNLKAMAEAVIVPEARQWMDRRIAHLPLPKAAPTLPPPMPTPEEEAAFAAQKAAAIAAMNAAPAYTPSALKRWRDSQERYGYLFMVKFDQGIELDTEDAAWMEAYERTPEYERYLKKRYESLRAVYERERARTTA